MNDGAYSLVQVTKEMLKHINIVSNVDCSSLCEILRLKLTEYLDTPINLYMMKDGSGYFYGCICR